MKRLGSDKVNLKNAFVAFNKLIYDEELTETDFELEWGKIKSYFETDHSDSSSNRMRYLNSLYENRHKWSRSCCPVVFDAGLTTSQRAESFNALVKKHLCKKTTLDQLMKELLENVENREMETERDDNVRAKISGNRADTGFRVVTWLAKRLTRYAFKIAYEQFVASGKCEVLSPNDDSLPSIVCYDGKETPDAEVAADGRVFTVCPVVTFSPSRKGRIQKLCLTRWSSLGGERMCR